MEAVQQFQEALRIKPDYWKAATNLGQAYNTGQGVEIDHQKAFSLFKDAADKGQIPEAQFDIGVMYLDGVGVMRNQQEAIRYLELAAKAGLEAAKTTLEKERNYILEENKIKQKS